MAVAASHRTEPRWLSGGEVRRAVCHLISGRQYRMGPLETTGGCLSVSGMDNNNVDEPLCGSALPGVHLWLLFLVRWSLPST